MKATRRFFRSFPRVAGAVAFGGILIFAVLAQTTRNPTPRVGEAAQPEVPGAPPGGDAGFDGPPGGFDGPPPFGGPGGPGFGGPSGPMGGQKVKLVKQFDEDGNGWLNGEERKAAREYARQQGAGRGRGGFRGGPPGGFGGRGGGDQAQPLPGRRLTPDDVKSFPGAPIYDALTLRTFFLEFESADWEKELADFRNTDVEVPAKLTVDGATCRDVGVHFRGNTSYLFVGEGRKRPLNLSLDFVHKEQRLGGYRTFNLLNAHEDPSFLHTVLCYHVAREYFPAPQANFVRVVINGECWGVYVNAQQINKEFGRDFLGTSQGARWKVPVGPGGPGGGRGGLVYLGEDPSAYRGIYQIKSKDDSESWDALIRLCRVLDQTPPDKLEPALDGLLDVEGTLRFLALDNVLVNGDGFWTRACDYYLCRDQRGCFHLVPQDVNETFSTRGGPGGPGGPRGFGGPGGFAGPLGFGGGGGPGGFGPGMLVADQMLEQGDKNQDGRFTKDEWDTLAAAWFDRLDPDKAGKIDREQFVANLGSVLLPSQAFGPRGGGASAGGRPGDPSGPARGRGGFGPGMFVGPGLFTALDTDKDGSLTRAEMKETFARWFREWDTERQGALPEDRLRTGLNKVLPPQSFAMRGGGPGGGRGGRGGGGFGGGPPGMGGVKLDPLVAANDTGKPLISKLLAVPSLRARYLACVHDIADKWLDWNRLGPVARQYHELIAEDVKADTRKVYSTQDFLTSLSGEAPDVRQRGSSEVGETSLRQFAEQRRAYLLNYTKPTQP